MISRQIAMLFGVMTFITTTVMAFMPMESVAAFSMRGKRQVTQQMLVNPQEVVSSVSDHPLFEVFLSTLYNGAVLLEPAHGHSQPFFGAPDQFLLQGKSILPEPGAFDFAELKGPEIQLSTKMAEFFDYAKSKGGSIIDPREVIQVNELLPGFTKTGHFLPELKTYPVSEKGIKLELAQTIGYQRVFNELPRVAAIAAFVDFFLISPGLDAYKEEIDDDPEGAIAGTITEFGVRTAALSIVAALTLALFNY